MGQYFDCSANSSTASLKVIDRSNVGKNTKFANRQTLAISLSRYVSYLMISRNVKTSLRSKRWQFHPNVADCPIRHTLNEKGNYRVKSARVSGSFKRASVSVTRGFTHASLNSATKPLPKHLVFYASEKPKTAIRPPVLPKNHWGLFQPR